MDQNRINQEWTDRVDQHETPIDVNQIWSGIEAQQKKKKRRIWIFLFPFLLGSLLFGSFFISFNTNDNDTEIANAVLSNEKKVPSASTRDIIQTASIENETSSQTATEEILTPSTTMKSVPYFRSAEKRPSANKIQKTQGQIIPTSSTSTKSIIESVFATEKNIPSAGNEKSLVTYQPVAFLPLLAPNLVAEHDPIQLDLIPSIAFDKKANDPSWEFSWGLGLGAFYNKKSLEPSASDTETVAYAENKLNSEKPLETLEFSTEFIAQAKSGFYAGTGIQYMSITERFSHTSSTTTLLNPHLQSSFLVHTERRKLYNHFRLIEIPLFIGIQKNGKRFQYGFHIGPNFNLGLSTDGSLLTTQGEVQQISTIDLYKSRVGLSLSSQFNVGYQLSDSFTITMSLKGKKYLSNFVTDTSGLKQHHSFIGTSIGIYYKL